MKSLAVCTHLATEPGHRGPEAPNRRSYFYRSQVWFHQFSLHSIWLHGFRCQCRGVTGLLWIATTCRMMGTGTWALGVWGAAGRSGDRAFRYNTDMAPSEPDIGIVMVVHNNSSNTLRRGSASFGYKLDTLMAWRLTHGCRGARVMESGSPANKVRGCRGSQVPMTASAIEMASLFSCVAFLKDILYLREA